jgi:hypothetical protein
MSIRAGRAPSETTSSLFESEEGRGGVSRSSHEVSGLVTSHVLAFTEQGSDVSDIVSGIMPFARVDTRTSFRADVAEGSCGLGFFSGVRRCEHKCQFLYHALGRHLPMD